MTSLSLPSYLEQPAYRLKLERARQQTAINREPEDIRRARVNFTNFKQAIYKRYLHAPHLQVLDDALMSACRYIETGGREGDGLIFVNMPPRHGKSFTVARLFPAWFVGRYPDWRIILASYAAHLSHKHGRFARNLMMAPTYQQIFNGVALAADSRAANAWDVEGRDGGMEAVGVGGGVTGKGGQLILCDDLISGRKDAESKTVRDSTWDWFTDDLYTRREPGGAIIVTNTRWQIDDPMGRALRLMPGRWKVINLPAVATPPREAGADWRDMIGRKAGDALWPERYPLETLREIEATLGPYAWASLYQQQPVPTEGGVIKRAWLPRVSHAPEIVQTVRYWDLAMTDKTSGDHTAGVKLGWGADGHYYVLDVARGQIDWGNLPEFMAQVMMADGPTVGQGIEQKGYMSRAIQDLNQDARLRGYGIFGYPADANKLTRALPFVAKCAAGLVHVVEGHWTDAYIEELCSFTGSGDEEDDQVDASAGAYTMIGQDLFTGAVHYADQASYSPY